MKMLRVTVSAPMGFIRPIDASGTIVESNDFPYFSTIQGILARILDRDIHLEDFLPISYTFTYNFRSPKVYDLMITHKKSGKKLTQDRVHYFYLVNPKLDIYIRFDEKLYEELKKPKYPIYFGNPYFLATVTISKVDLEKYDPTKHKTKGGIIIRSRERHSVQIVASYEFEYKNFYKRKPRSFGKHIYIPPSVTKYKLTNKENLNNAYYDPELEKVVILFDRHPSIVYGGGRK